jgi:hypothetical protein
MVILSHAIITAARPSNITNVKQKTRYSINDTIRYTGIFPAR